MHKYECADPSLQEAFDNGTLGYLPRPKSKYKLASLEKRAAQFMPFAALKGYEESIEDATRYVIEKKQLSEDQQQEINDVLCSLEVGNSLKIEYFVKDKVKPGGQYETYIGVFKKLDQYSMKIYLDNDTVIRIYDIYSIEIE